MPKPSTLRLIEIAELLGVTKQRAHQIAEEKGFPTPLGEDRPRPSLEPVRGAGVGDAVAAGEALALAQELHEVGVAGSALQEPADDAQDATPDHAIQAHAH